MYKSLVLKYITCLTFLVFSAVLVSSCATASFSKYKGVGRVKTYNIYSKDLPRSFDGFKIAFATDFHYESRFTHSRLEGMKKAIASVSPDIIILGGDYMGRNGGNIDELFDAIKGASNGCRIYAVMGNHERGDKDRLVRQSMNKTGVKLLEHQIDSVFIDNEFIILCGIRNPFNLEENGVSPTLQLSPSDFVIMISHTPDYAEDTDISNTDLVLSGHTHGGQVSLFNRWTPAKFSKYGNKFLTGLKYNSSGIPIVISNGLGTSRRDIRLFTPSEVVLIVLNRD